MEPLGPFEAQSELAVAVSGGPDSMALALLANDWATARGGKVLALTVEHGLRPEAADEVALVTEWLNQRGIRTLILSWRGPKPLTGIQAAAREARRQLLLSACRSAGILHLLLAHQAEDQAETAAMRHGRGSGADGVAGMAAVLELTDLRLLRPLLGIPKARLKATLIAAGQSWIEDPSNHDPRFSRAGLRLGSAFDASAWWCRARAAGEVRRARDEALAAFFAASAAPHALGWLSVDRAGWLLLPEPLRHAALARALTAVRGNRYPPASAIVRHLVARLSGGADNWRVSAAGCLLEAQPTRWTVAREPGRVSDRIVVRPGGSVIWDDRFKVVLKRASNTFEVGALGRMGCASLPKAVRDRLRQAAVPLAAVAALPAFDVEQRLACPSLALFGLPLPPGIEAAATLHATNPLAGPTFGSVNVVSKV
jgi:tRNA(Ile)-lysidine synthase